MADPLTDILTQLENGRQRATYGAVAGVLNAVPLYLMSNRPRDPFHSWVVSAKSGLPSKYAEHEMHPDLLANARVIDSADDLQAWLDARS